jgi:hypothetical protein
MGYRFTDQFSLLHFAVGVVMYYLNFSFFGSVLKHILFEYLENTEKGMELINKYIIKPGYFHWPGGKHKADSLINMIGDTVYFSIGWGISYMLDIYGSKNNWYLEK